MNEKIDDLIEQATIERYWNKEFECWIDSHVDTQKLAELIIVECAELMDREYGYSEGEAVLKHFGVNYED